MMWRLRLGKEDGEDVLVLQKFVIPENQYGYPIYGSVKESGSFKDANITDIPINQNIFNDAQPDCYTTEDYV